MLIDPLLLDEAGWEALDAVVDGPVETLVTIPYHTRSAEQARRRYGGSIWGHRAVARRLEDPESLRVIAPGEELPGGASAHRIGNPVRYEMPIFVPELRALVFGDAVVGTDGGLRVWTQGRVTGRRGDWYERRLIPSLRPLLDLDGERVLVTHGPSVLGGGRRALERALAAGPWPG
ncbi:MAG TPA: hypothetical protein VFW18_01720 [Gaiellales bacterium]|nr:hypothetical protein [Gaiellales bacterium]